MRNSGRDYVNEIARGGGRQEEVWHQPNQGREHSES